MPSHADWLSDVVCDSSNVQRGNNKADSSLLLVCSEQAKIDCQVSMVHKKAQKQHVISEFAVPIASLKSFFLGDDLKILCTIHS